MADRIPAGIWSHGTWNFSGHVTDAEEADGLGLLNSAEVSEKGLEDVRLGVLAAQGLERVEFGEETGERGWTVCETEKR